MSKITSKKHRKKRENQGFWPPKIYPKPTQNPFKIDVPKNMRFALDVRSIFFYFLIFDFLKMCILPK